MGNPLSELRRIPETRTTRLLEWLKRNFFGSPFSIAITLTYGVAIWAFLPPLLKWAFFDATFVGTHRANCSGGGACWAFVRVWLEQLLYGRYPIDQRWRIELLWIFLALLFALVILGSGRMRLWAGIALVFGFPVGVALLVRGGLFGLVPVDSAMLGGLALNVFLAVTAGALSLPLGVLLALARRSRLPVVRFTAVAYIEIWRGLPLMTILFTALILLPLFLPESWDVSALSRAYIAMTMVYAAYMAEVVRGGLQVIPAGQSEAAAALGLGTWQTNALIVLPQALRHVTPAIVNTLVELFKDSTLVYMIGLFDVLGVLSLALRDLEWVGLAAEAYVTVAVIYFLCCQVLSTYGQYLERQGAAQKR
jgi:general L-amino acid transport system permease protein